MSDLRRVGFIRPIPSAPFIIENELVRIDNAYGTKTATIPCVQDDRDIAFECGVYWGFLDPNAVLMARVLITRR